MVVINAPIRQILSLDPFYVRVTLYSSGMLIMGSSLYKRKGKGKKNCPLILLPSFSVSILTTFHTISNILIMLTKGLSHMKSPLVEKKERRETETGRQTDRQRHRERDWERGRKVGKKAGWRGRRKGGREEGRQQSQRKILKQLHRSKDYVCFA